MLNQGSYAFAAPLWVHPGEGGWHFVTVPPDVSAEIAERTSGARQGFGSVRVAVAVRGTAWRTSLFPDAASRAYLLPVKKSVRAAARLEADDVLEVEIDVEM